MINKNDPITKIYIINFKAWNPKEEKEFQELLNRQPRVLKWVKHLMLQHGGNDYD